MQLWFPRLEIERVHVLSRLNLADRNQAASILMRATHASFYCDYARNRKTDTGLLSGMLRVRLLILGRIGHLKCKAVHHKSPTATPFPLRICFRFGTQSNFLAQGLDGRFP